MAADAGTPHEAARRIGAEVAALGIEHFDLMGEGAGAVAAARASGHRFRRARSARWAAR
jgi:hypothetical protein